MASGPAPKGIDRASSDPTAPASLDDQCLVHHFIRARGRRPSPDELEALRARVALVARAVDPPAPGSPGANRSVRRDLARLVARW